MKKALIFLGLSLLFFSCGKKNNEQTNKTEVIIGFVVDKEMPETEMDTTNVE